MGCSRGLAILCHATQAAAARSPVPDGEPLRRDDVGEPFVELRGRDADEAARFLAAHVAAVEGAA